MKGNEMGKKKKVVEVVVMHQHVGLNGRVFGASHPIDAVHKNTKTQKAHDGTTNGYPNQPR